MSKPTHQHTSELHYKCIVVTDMRMHQMCVKNLKLIKLSETREGLIVEGHSNQMGFLLHTTSKLWSKSCNTYMHSVCQHLNICCDFNFNFKWNLKQRKYLNVNNQFFNVLHTFSIPIASYTKCNVLTLFNIQHITSLSLLCCHHIM